MNTLNPIPTETPASATPVAAASPLPTLPLLAPRPDDILANLPVEDQRRLLHWLATRSMRQTQKLAARPRPEGLDLHVSLNTITRYRSKHLDTSWLATSDSANGSPRTSTVELMKNLREKALAEIQDPDTPLSEQARLAGLVMRLATLETQDRKASQKEQDLQLREKRHHLSAQRFTFQSVHLLRQYFPFPDQIDLNHESQDIHKITCLLNSVLSGGSAPSNPAPNSRSFAPFAPSRDTLLCPLRNLRTLPIPSILLIPSEKLKSPSCHAVFRQA